MILARFTDAAMHYICFFKGFDLENVATVQANGDIEVESMFAGTLPTVHPNIMERNLELLAELKAPPPEEPVELFIGILSAGSHFTERMAVRRSWMSVVRNSSSTMARFFVALVIYCLAI